MKMICVFIALFTLCSCVDLGRVGIHPELKTLYFDENQSAVADCLFSSALKQKLDLIPDDAALSEEVNRFSLRSKKDNADVAWVDLSSSTGAKQTSVNFYYAPHAPDVHRAIVSMISQCQK